MGSKVALQPPAPRCSPDERLLCVSGFSELGQLALTLWTFWSRSNDGRGWRPHLVLKRLAGSVSPCELATHMASASYSENEGLVSAWNLRVSLLTAFLA